MPIPRNVISNIENARKLNVSVPEVIALAAALDVPPAALIFPAGYVDQVDYLPWQSSDPLQAIDWLAGEKMQPHQEEEKPRTPQPPPAPIWAISRVREHRDLIDRIWSLHGTIVADLITREPNPEIEAVREMISRLERQLHQLRAEMTSQGLRLPWLPAYVQPLKAAEPDDEGHTSP